MSGSQTAPRGSQVQSAGNELCVGPFPRFPHLRHHGRIGDSNGQCPPTPVAALVVEQGPLGDAEQPRPRIFGIGGQVLESTPGNQECVTMSSACVGWTRRCTNRRRSAYVDSYTKRNRASRSGPDPASGVLIPGTCPSHRPVCLDSDITVGHRDSPGRFALRMLLAPVREIFPRPRPMRAQPKARVRKPPVTPAQFARPSQVSMARSGPASGDPTAGARQPLGGQPRQGSPQRYDAVREPKAAALKGIRERG